MNSMRTLFLALIGGGLAAVTWAAVKDVQNRKIQRVNERTARQQRANEARSIRQKGAQEVEEETHA